MSNRRHAALRKTIRVLTVCVLFALLCGCASFRSAQLYREGTRDLNAGRHDRAVLQLEEAAQLAPDVSEIQNHLGLALAAAGQHDAALLAFERAVDLDCDNEAAAKNLAAARMRAAQGLNSGP